MVLKMKDQAERGRLERQRVEEENTESRKEAQEGREAGGPLVTLLVLGQGALAATDVEVAAATLETRALPSTGPLLGRWTVE